MIKYYTKERGKLVKEIPRAVSGCWINISPPFNRQELELVSKELDIPIDFFEDSLDIDERSRYEQEDGVQLIVVNIPIKNDFYEENGALYRTIPIGIIEVSDYILTISSFENQIINHFLSPSAKTLDTRKHSHFVLLLLDRTVYYFLHFLKEMDNQRNIYEKELYHSSRNQELSKLMTIQKSLVYFVTTLRDNERMMTKMQRTDFLKVRDKEEELDFFEDILIDIGQATEMARIYSDILSSTMDAFASIISNNLNTIMKRLTSITIILMVPTLVASFFGMNVAVPWQADNTLSAFLVIVLVSAALTFALMWFFMRKRLF